VKQAISYNRFITSLGIGLGLYVTKHIVDSMKGELTIKSKQGQGTTCIINVPAAVEERKETVK
jgi:signal transduction histidine kinase